MQKTCMVLQEKRFWAPALPLLVAALSAGVAAVGCAAVADAVVAGAAVDCAAAAGAAAAGAAADCAVAAGAAAAGAVAAAAALWGPIRQLGRRPLVLGGWGLQLPGI